MDRWDATPYPIAVELAPLLVHAIRNLPDQREDLLLVMVSVAMQAESPSPLSGPVSAVLRAAVPDLCRAWRIPTRGYASPPRSSSARWPGRTRTWRCPPLRRYPKATRTFRSSRPHSPS